MNRLTALSLYCGAGGLDLGFESQEVDVVMACDTNKTALQTFTASRPNTKVLHGRVDELDLTGLSVDIIMGGPPCQGFSAGKKLNITDERNREPFNFIDVVEKLRPRAVVMENVPPLLTSKALAPIREALLDRYAALGYSVEWKIWQAEEHGVPQRRRRAILVALRDGQAHTDAPHQPSSRALEVILSAQGTGTRSGSKITPMKNPILRSRYFSGMLFNGSGRLMDLRRPSPTIVASGGASVLFYDERQLKNPDAEQWGDRYLKHLQEGGKATWDIPQEHLCRLSTGEAAALQTFPVDYPWQGSTSSQFRQIGNAVPPALAAAIAREIVGLLQ